MLTNLLDLTCNVEQVTVSDNDFGGQIKSYSTRLSSVPCSLKAITKNNSETDAYGKRTLIVVYRFYFEATTANQAITESDRILFNSEYYHVNFNYNVAGKGRLLRVDCTKVD